MIPPSAGHVPEPEFHPRCKQLERRKAARKGNRRAPAEANQRAEVFANEPNPPTRRGHLRQVTIDCGSPLPPRKDRQNSFGKRTLTHGPLLLVAVAAAIADAAPNTPAPQGPARKS